MIDHFTLEIVYSWKMLRPCEAERSKAREIGAGDALPAVKRQSQSEIVLAEAVDLILMRS